MKPRVNSRMEYPDFKSLVFREQFRPRMLSIHLAMASVMLLAYGCGKPQQIEPSPLCAGKPTIEQAAFALAAQRDQLAPFQASARCVMEWRDAEDRLHRESFDARAACVPPERVFFRADKFGEIRFGANESEFWLRIKPELDTYWYGTRQQAQRCAHVLMINPANLAEALGVVHVDTNWELFHRDGYDLLTQRRNGRPVKRVYVNCCDYRVRRIEYYDPQGQVVAATELSDYTPIDPALVVPTHIRLMTIYQGLEESSARIELRNIRRFDPTPAQLENLFSRPGRDGYGTVLRLDENCTFSQEL